MYTYIYIYIFELITRSENLLTKYVKSLFGGRYITIILKIITLEKFRIIDSPSLYEKTIQVGDIIRKSMNHNTNTTTSAINSVTINKRINM